VHLRPAVVSHQEVDIASHVALERVVVVESLELQLVDQLLLDRRLRFSELVDAVDDDPEHLQDVRHAPAVALRQLRLEATTQRR